jgi:hypothetical protein
MLTWVAKKLFGTANDRTIRRMRAKVPLINAKEEPLAGLISFCHFRPVATRPFNASGLSHEGP